MPATQAFVRGAVSLLIGGLHLAVGRLILRRTALSPDAATANRLFATWWFALAGVYLLGGPFNLAYSLGWRDLSLTVAYLDLVLLAYCVGLWGILAFLVYVYAGTHQWLRPLAVSYAVVAAGLIVLVAWIDPVGFVEGSSTLQLEYGRPLGGVSSLLLGLLLSVPTFTVAVAYMLLATRVTEPGPRYRILMVGGAFASQFGWSIVSALLGLSRRFPGALWLELVNQGVAVLVPVLVMAAYRPPRWVRARIEPAGAVSEPPLAVR